MRQTLYARHAHAGKLLAPRSDELNTRPRARNKSAFDSAGNQVRGLPPLLRFPPCFPREITSPPPQSKPCCRPLSIFNRAARAVIKSYAPDVSRSDQEGMDGDWQSISSNFAAIQYFQLRRAMGVNVFHIVLSTTERDEIAPEICAKFTNLFRYSVSPSRESWIADSR